MGLIKGRTSIVATLLAAGVAALLGACSSSTDDFTGTNISQRSIHPDTAETISLLAGDTLTVPAGTFNEETVLVFADVFTGGDGSVTYFPTATKAPADLLGAVVINTPVDKLYNNNVTLTFDLLQPGETHGATAVTAGQQYQVYRFDFDNLVWQPWGGTSAQVDAGGNSATVTLPTAGFRGFIGSLALFNGLLAGSTVPTVIHGTVVDQAGGGVATDVGLYINVGGINYPVAIQGGRVPDLNDNASGLPTTIANTINSNADGTFTMTLLDSTVGQVVSLQFGMEDPAHSDQIRFDVLAPATPGSNVTNFTVRYGENNVRSAPVLAQGS